MGSNAVNSASSRGGKKMGLGKGVPLSGALGGLLLGLARERFGGMLDIGFECDGEARR